MCETTLSNDRTKSSKTVSTLSNVFKMYLVFHSSLAHWMNLSKSWRQNGFKFLGHIFSSIHVIYTFITCSQSKDPLHYWQYFEALLKQDIMRTYWESQLKKYRRRIRNCILRKRVTQTLNPSALSGLCGFATLFLKNNVNR